MTCTLRSGSFRHNARPIVSHHCRLQRKLLQGEMNSLDYLEAICYQCKTKFKDLEDLFRVLIVEKWILDLKLMI